MESNKGWQCPCCGTVYSPLITQCTCSKKTSVHDCPDWSCQPIQPWNNIPNNENKEYYSGITTINGGLIICNSCGALCGEASGHVCATTLS